MESSPYTTQDQLNSANIMGQVASAQKVDMVWGIGDNFYNDGVKNEYDTRFSETFENVFTARSLQNIPFYMVGGYVDHSYLGNITGEIMYSNHSSRWTFPDIYYTKTFNIPDTDDTLQLLMIDTVTLVGIKSNPAQWVWIDHTLWYVPHFV